MPVGFLGVIIKDRKPVSLETKISVREAARLLAHWELGAAPLMRKSQLLGIVTETDMAARIVAAAADPEASPLADTMTPNPYRVAGDDPLVTTRNIMTDHRVRHLPVLGNGHTVVLENTGP